MCCSVIGVKLGHVSNDPDRVWSSLGLPSVDPYQWAWQGDSRWVRFYSLASGQQYPTTAADYDEALSRNLTVLKELFRDDEQIMFVTGSQRDPDRPLSQTQVQSKAQPDALPWHEMPDPEFSPDEVWPCRLWVSWTSLSELDLEGILREVADRNLEWVSLVALSRAVGAHPYNGGIDILLPTSTERDELRAKYAPWASPRPDGL